MIVSGSVVGGKRLGRKLGFPTANIQPDAPLERRPENGVYAARIDLNDGAGWRPCVLNHGKHPTSPGGEPTIEAHIMDYDGDLYGLRVSVEYVVFLRAERKFESLDALKAQIARDRDAAREVLR